MRKLALALVLIAANAYALPQRTFVSAQRGADGNSALNCTSADPCRTFNAALAVTNPGGEIIVLDSGGYGPVSIDRSVAIIAPRGVYAGITAFSGNAVTVATPSDAIVLLRGLTLNSLGGTNGIDAGAVEQLVVEDCTIARFTTIGNAGILFTGPGAVRVSGLSSIANYDGVRVSPGPRSNAVAQVTGCQFDKTKSVAVVADGGAIVDVTDSVAFNGYSGFVVMQGRLTCTRCTASYNLNGFVVDYAGSVLRLNGCVAVENQFGLIQYFDGTLESLGNNLVRGNTTDLTGTKTSILPQ